MTTTQSYPEHIQRMLNMFLEGKTLAQIGQAVGYSPSHVYQLFNRHGIKSSMRASNRTKVVDIHALVDQYKAGQTLVQLAQSHGVSVAHVHTLLKMQGVSRGDRYVAPFDAPYDVEAMTRAYRAGQTIEDIAKELGFTPWRVRKIFQEHNVSKREGKLSAVQKKERLEAILVAYQSGKTLIAIGEELGISRQRVQQILRQHRVNQDARGCRVCGASRAEQADAIRAQEDMPFEPVSYSSIWQRDQALIAMYRSGECEDVIAKRFRISRERVFQLLNRHGVSSVDRGCPICAQFKKQVETSPPTGFEPEPDA